MQFIQDIFVALRLILKAKFAMLAAGIVLVTMLAAFLSSYFSGRQLVTVALDVGFSTVRMLFPLLIVFLIQEVVFREFDKRYYLSSFSYPRMRSGFLVGRVAAVLVFVLVMLLVVAILQIGLMQFISKIYPQSTPVSLGKPYFTVFFFIGIDLLVLTAVATFISVFASTSSFVLVGTLGFMLVARSYGSVVALLGREDGLVANAELYRNNLGFLGYLLPDLGALDVRMIALYNKMDFFPNDWGWLLLSSLGYSVALFALSVLVVQCKRFS